MVTVVSFSKFLQQGLETGTPPAALQRLVVVLHALVGLELQLRKAAEGDRPCGKGPGMNQLIYHQISCQIELSAIKPGSLKAKEVAQNQVENFMLDHRTALFPVELFNKEAWIHHQTHAQRRQGDRRSGDCGIDPADN